MIGPRRDALDRPTVARVVRLQAVYYATTGIWPVLHLRSFEAISGPKRDGWLVQSFGLLLAAIAASLATGARRVSPETAVLAVSSATALATVDVVFVAKRRIRPVYLLDAAVEVGLVAGLVRAATR